MTTKTSRAYSIVTGYAPVSPNVEKDGSTKQPTQTK
jgi:hypothetical protein